MNGRHKMVRGDLLVVLGLGLALVGCNTRPEMPKTDWHGKPVKVLTVNPSDPMEAKLATEVETARGQYHHLLTLLKEFYDLRGNATKGRWAAEEIENVAKAQDFTFEGITPPPPPEGPLADDARENVLIEDTTVARDAYLTKLDDLAELYEKNNDDFKAYMIHTVQARFFSEETYLYLHKSELPPKDLQPGKIIPKANDMYDAAMQLYLKGIYSLPVDYSKLRKALSLFLRLIRQFPQSTRIALAAFYIGELYKDYFEEPYLAVRWLERAWTWDPYIPKPARFEAATVCDLKLDDKRRAAKLFKESIRLEPYWPENVKVAKERIKDIEGRLEYIPSVEEEMKPPVQGLTSPPAPAETPPPESQPGAEEFPQPTPK